MMQEQIDKSILEKQNLHCQTLLKMIKTLKQEKQKLEDGFKDLQNNCEEKDNEIEKLKQKIRKLDIKSQDNNQDMDQLKQTIQELSCCIQEKDHKIEQLQIENAKLQEQLQNIKETQFQPDHIQAYFSNQQQNLQSSIISTTLNKDINQSIIAHDEYNKTRIKVTKEQVNFIEEFYIITIPDSDLIKPSPQPKVVFKHPIEAESIVPGLLSQLPLFIFPHSIKTVPITKKSELQNILNMKIKRENINLTVFTPSKATGMKIKNQFINDSNPDQLLYAISIMDTDFLVEERHKIKQQVSQSKKYIENIQHIHRTTVAYVILTYFPFIEFFSGTLLRLVDQLKTTRLESLGSDQPRDWKYMDAYFFSFYENDIRIYFDQLKNVSLNFQYPLYVPQFGQIDYKIDQLVPYLYTFEGAPQNLLQGWDGGIIVAIFAGLLLEYKIIIQGHSREQIAYLMLLFLFAIKPFNYCHPFLLEVPESQYPLIEAPVPVFLGTTDYHIASDECVIIRAWGRTPKIENGKSIRSPALSELVKKLDYFFQDFSKQNYKFLYKIEGIVSLCNSFLKLEILKNNNQNDNFVQMFYQTQLYHNYMSQ